MMGVVGRISWRGRLAVTVAAITLAVGALAGASRAGTAAAAVGQSGGVIVISHTDAWAVVAGTTGQFLHWNGKKWSPVQGPKLNGEDLVSLAAVSASSIWAVGGFVNAHGSFVPLALHWNGKRW